MAHLPTPPSQIPQPLSRGGLPSRLPPTPREQKLLHACTSALQRLVNVLPSRLQGDGSGSRDIAGEPRPWSRGQGGPVARNRDRIKCYSTSAELQLLLTLPLRTTKHGKMPSAVLVGSQVS